MVKLSRSKYKNKKNGNIGTAKQITHEDIRFIFNLTNIFATLRSLVFA